MRPREATFTHIRGLVRDRSVYGFDQVAQQKTISYSEVAEETIDDLNIDP